MRLPSASVGLQPFAFSLSYEAFLHAEGRRLQTHASVGLLTLLQLLRPPSHVRPCACSTCLEAVGRAFPTAIADVYMNRIAYFIALARLFCGASVNRGDPTCFPGRDCVHLGSLAVQDRRVHCVHGHGSHLAFKFVYSGGVSSGFEGCLSFLGLWVSRWKSNR